MNKYYSGVLNIWNDSSVLKGNALIDEYNYILSLNVINDIITNDDVFGVMVGGDYLYYQMSFEIIDPVIVDNSINAFSILIIKDDGLRLVINNG